MDNLQVLEMQNQRVLTTQQLAEGYGATETHIKQNFNNHKKRFEDGEHFFYLTGESLKEFKNQVDNIDLVSKHTSSLYLWTEKGALRHAKILDTEQAWEVYDKLVETYFRVKQQQIDYSQLSPEMQMFNQMFKAVANMELEQKKTQQLAIEAKTTADSVAQKVETIKDTIIKKDENWRESINMMLNKVVKSNGDGNYQAVRNESYRLLEERAGCKLEIRLKNLKYRLLESGATKGNISKANKLDVVEDDKKLKEIYSAIVREMTVKAVM